MPGEPSSPSIWNSREEMKSQYRDASNLNARSAIYRFATDGGTPWPRWVFDQLLRLPAKARVLEIGCGDGALWQRNADRTPAGWRVTLCDLSPGMLTGAREKRLTFPLVQGDAQQLPLADGQFDGVVANHMLYHMRSLKTALAEVKRVLRPGGKLFATTNSELHMRRMKDLINRFLGDDSPLAQPMPFTVENGLEQIRPFLRRVEILSTPGELRVTDPQAVVNYVMSVEGAPQRITGKRLEELRRVVRDEIEAAGAFVVATAAGMFIAGD
jgi:SAM-dependent methyltransferase